MKPAQKLLADSGSCGIARQLEENLRSTLSLLLFIALPCIGQNPRPGDQRTLEQRVQSLEGQVERLKLHANFLQQVLISHANDGPFHWSPWSPQKQETVCRIDGGLQNVFVQCFNPSSEHLDIEIDSQAMQPDLSDCRSVRRGATNVDGIASFPNRKACEGLPDVNQLTVTTQDGKQATFKIYRGVPPRIE